MQFARWFCIFGSLLGHSLLDAAEFGIHVVDEADGRGIPMAIVRMSNGVEHLTDSAGWIRIDEPGLMHSRVRLEIHSPGYRMPARGKDSAAVELQFSTTGDVVVPLVRVDIAQRMYRVTGTGIYRDSELLNREVPLPIGNHAAGLVSAWGVQRASIGKKVVWCWRQSLLSHGGMTSVSVAGAWSDFPEHGGLDPTQGIHFAYLPAGTEQVHSLLTAEDPGAIWIEGLTSVPDETGKLNLVAHYIRQGAEGERAEHGIAIWTDEKRFERIVVLGDEYEWQFPAGQCVTRQPFCHVRCPARLDAVRNPGAFEALSWDTTSHKYTWQQSRPPMSQREESTWIAEGSISQPRTQVRDHNSQKPVPVQESSIEWNPHHRCYVMIASSVDGDVWFCESRHLEGPWENAIRIISAEPGRCSSPVQHPFMNQDGGRIIWFETALLDSGLPRYDRNELMHRLDLDDPRLKPALAKN